MVLMVPGDTVEAPEWRDMATEFRLPQLTESAAAVKLSSWLKREGDTVKKGEPIAEVETDKTNVELEAPEAGVLVTIHVAAGGEGLKPGTLLCTIGEAGAAAAVPVAAVAPVAAPVPVAPAAAAPAAAPAAVPPVTAPVQAPVVAAPVATASAPPSAVKVAATPLAARMAEVAGLDLSTVQTGGRRITKADVEAAIGRGPAAARRAEPAAASAPVVFAVPNNAPFVDQPLTAMRRVTGERLQQAKQVVPHFYLQSEVRADALLAMRKQINESSAGVKVTVTDLLVAACARALVRVPAANSAFNGTSVRLFENVDIAVAVNTPNGLITPVIRGTQRKPIPQISRDLKDLSERARLGKLKPEEYSNGTFTISNLGMYEISTMTPILNPPQCCILGVGATTAKPVVENGQIVVGHTMWLTLAADHRALDGVGGAELMREIKHLIEDPMSIVLGV